MTGIGEPPTFFQKQPTRATELLQKTWCFASFDEGLTRRSLGLRALLAVLTGQNLRFGLEPVLVFVAGSASPFLVQLVSTLTDLGVKIRALRICRRRSLADLGRRGRFRHGQNLFVGWCGGAGCSCFWHVRTPLRIQKNVTRKHSGPRLRLAHKNV